MFWDHYSNCIDKILLWELVFQKEMYRIIDVKWMCLQCRIHQGHIKNSGACDSNWNKVTIIIFPCSRRENNAYFICKLSIMKNVWCSSTGCCTHIAVSRLWPQRSDDFIGYQVVTDTDLTLECILCTCIPRQQRCGLALLHSRDFRPQFLCLACFFQLSPGILWSASRELAHCSLGHYTPTLSSRILYKLVSAV